MPPKRKRPPVQIRAYTEEPTASTSVSQHTNISLPARPGRKARQTTTFYNEPIPPDTSAAPEPAEQPAVMTDDATLFTQNEEVEEIVVPPPANRSNKKKRQVDALQDWKAFRDTFLEEMLRHEGLRSHRPDDLCQQCHENPGLFRCQECVDVHWVCKNCMLLAHPGTPLHRIVRWNGTYFEPFSLRELGYRVPLGHDGEPCPNPHDNANTIVVVDLSGIHKVDVVYCGCGIAGSSHPVVQLLRAGWWPVTVHQPRTVVTISTLRTYHALNLQSKLNAYDFYSAISRLTDNTGTRPPPYRYKEFIRATREYRHLRSLKRAGIGHEPGGVESARAGDLVVECPCCPWPGRNLPEDWESAPESERWKYALLLAVDANFKLKLKNRGLQDVDLSPGWSYFVNEADYQAHLAEYIDEPEMKYCDSNHSAIDHANTPSEKRFVVNGVGAVICARHCFYRKHGVGDLQRGEKYSNMDFILLSTLLLTATYIQLLLISYDIACSFSKNFFHHTSKYPEAIQPTFIEEDVKWAVPKFHLLAHGPKCQSSYSLNFTKGVGRTHGEGIETGWSDTNHAALSTREMAPAARREVVEDVLGAINWRKLISLGPALAKGLREAVPERDKKVKIIDDWTATLSSDVCASWKKMMDNYDKDRNKPNPYEEPAPSTTLPDVQKELKKQEADELARGVLSLHETTASTFLSVGFELEEQQRVLKISTNKGSPSFMDKQNALRRRIYNWRKIQVLYMPCVNLLLNTVDRNTAEINDVDHDPTLPPESISLYLPSSIDRRLWENGCALGLVQKEARLRRAQAEDALYQVRRSLRMQLGLGRYAQVHVHGPGQGPNTRARALLSGLGDKLRRHVARYRAAYAALVILDPDGEWKDVLQPLRAEDVRPPRKEDDGEPGEGRFEVSWIWRVLRPDVRDLLHGDESSTQEDVHNAIRIDWVKARARADRWEEEVTLLSLEMYRAVVFLEWREQWWLGKVGRRTLPRDKGSGFDAYCYRQAAIVKAIAQRYVSMWRPVLEANNMYVPWSVLTYPAVAPNRQSRTMADDNSSSASSDSEDDSPPADIDDSDLDE